MEKLQIPQIPQPVELMWPTVLALRALGESGQIAEIGEKVYELEGFTDEQMSYKRREDDHLSYLDYRIAWARNYLKNIGVIANSSRGVWALTELGRSCTPEQIAERWEKHQLEYREQRKLEKQTALEDGDGEVDLEDDPDLWRMQLAKQLLALEPAAFERLAQRLLREAGFRNVQVLGKSNDGGIDGVGDYRLSLVTFPVYFQCKRWAGSVGSGPVRDFRGAMAGRGEKGLLITTGSFTREARNEATRDGAPPVELISGDELCDLLKEYELGVTTTRRTVEDVAIEDTFFGQL